MEPQKSKNEWYEFDLEEELIVEPGEYRISSYSIEGFRYRKSYSLC